MPTRLAAGVMIRGFPLHYIVRNAKSPACQFIGFVSLKRKLEKVGLNGTLMKLSLHWQVNISKSNCRAPRRESDFEQSEMLKGVQLVVIIVTI